MSDNGGGKKGEFKVVEMGGNGSGENGGGGAQGRDAVENGDGKNFGIESGSISGNGPEGRVEAQEGASGVKKDNDGLVSEKARGEVLEGSRSENGISTSGNGAREGEESQHSGNLNGCNKNPQKKTFTGMMIVLVVVLLVAVGLVVFVFWWTKELASETTDRVNGDGGTEVVEKPEGDGDEEISDALDKFHSGKPGNGMDEGDKREDKYVDAWTDIGATEYDRLVGAIVNEAIDVFNMNFPSEAFYKVGADKDFVTYKPDGFLTVVPLNKVYGYRIKSEYLAGDSGTNYYDEYREKVFPKIEKLLTERGFNTNEEDYGTWSGGPGRISYWNDDGVVCAFDSFTIGISCGYKSWYDVEDARLSNDLAIALEEVTGETPDLVVAKVDNIQDSEIVPYQWIDVARQGYGSTFYRVSPNDKWIYFTSGQSGPACSEYNTEDLKKAFFGRNCYSEGNDWNGRVTLER